MSPKTSLKTIKDFTTTPVYQNILRDVSEIIDQTRFKIVKAVDTQKVEGIWQIGERILREELQGKERAGYGEKIVPQLADDLTAQGKNTHKRRLYEALQFYRAFSDLKKVRAVHAQLSWYHFRELMKLTNDQERQFYIEQVIHQGWGYRKLQASIKDNYYLKSPERKYPRLKLKEPPVIDVREMFQSEYVFGDLFDIQTISSEKELEKQIKINLQQFLEVLGEDFCFKSAQEQFVIRGKAYSMDLVLFNRRAACPVLIDLKFREFKKEDVGQMNMYVNYYRENKQFPRENLAVGLIICNNKDDIIVKYALGGLEEKIFVAQYNFPSEQQITEKLKRLVGKK